MVVTVTQAEFASYFFDRAPTSLDMGVFLGYLADAIQLLLAPQ
jgi:hypothetical protein